MNKIERAISKLYFFPFLCVIIFISYSNICAAEDNSAEPEKMMEITVLDKVSNELLSGAKVNVRIIQDNGGDIRQVERGPGRRSNVAQSETFTRGVYEQ